MLASDEGIIKIYEWPISILDCSYFEFNINNLIHSNMKYFVSEMDGTKGLDGLAVVLNDRRCGFIPHLNSSVPGDLKLYFAHNVCDVVTCKINSRSNIILFGTTSSLIHFFTFESDDSNVSSNSPNYLKYIKLIDLNSLSTCNMDFLPSPIRQNSINEDNITCGTSLLSIMFTNDFQIMFVLCPKLSQIFVLTSYGFLINSIPNIQGDNQNDILTESAALTFFLGEDDYNLYVVLKSEECRHITETNSIVRSDVLLEYPLLKSIQCNNMSNNYNRSHCCILQGPDSIYLASPSFKTVNKFKEKFKILSNQLDNKAFANFKSAAYLDEIDADKSFYFTDLRDLTEIQVPLNYLYHNYPIKVVAIDKSGQGLAVAGKFGFLHLNILTRKWKMFGNESQEKEFTVLDNCLVWWKEYIFLSCLNVVKSHFEVRAYPQADKLDNINMACNLQIPNIFWGADDNISARNQGDASISVSHLTVFRDLLGIILSNRNIAIYTVTDEKESLKTKKAAYSITLININIIDITALTTDPSNIISFALTYFSIDSPLTNKNSNQRSTTVHNQTQPPNVILNVSGDLLCLQYRKKRLPPSSAILYPSEEDTHLNKGQELAPEQPVMKSSSTKLFSFASAFFFGSETDNETAFDNLEAVEESSKCPYDYSVTFVANLVENFWISELKRDQGDEIEPATAHANGKESLRVEKKPTNKHTQPYILDSLWLFRGSDGLKVWLPMTQPPGFANMTSDLFSKRIMLQIDANFFPLVVHANFLTIEGILQSLVKDRVVNYLLTENEFPEAKFVNERNVAYRHWQFVLPDVLMELLHKNQSLEALDVAKFYGTTISHYLPAKPGSKSSNRHGGFESEDNFTAEPRTTFSLSDALETLLHKALEAEPFKPIGKFNITGIKKTPPSLSRDHHSTKNQSNYYASLSKVSPPLTSNVDGAAPLSPPTNINFSGNNRSSLVSPPSSLPSPCGTYHDPEPNFPRVLAFLREFPFHIFVPVLVNCARKSEMALWPKLFSTLSLSYEAALRDEEEEEGTIQIIEQTKIDALTNKKVYNDNARHRQYDLRPTLLFKECLKRGDLDTATSLLVILQNIESSQQSLHDSWSLLTQTFHQQKWYLAKEIIRYLKSIENEFENEKVIRDFKLELSKKTTAPFVTPEVLLGPHCPFCCEDVGDGKQLTKSDDLTGQNDKRHLIDMELEYYALNLASKHEWKDLATLAANINFPLIRFLTKYRFKLNLRPNEFVEAFIKLHVMFDWPFGHYINIKYGSRRNSKSFITSPNSLGTQQSALSSNANTEQYADSSPNSIQPSVPEINLAKLIEPVPVDLSSTGISKHIGAVNPQVLGEENCHTTELEKVLNKSPTPSDKGPSQSSVTPEKLAIKTIPSSIKTRPNVLTLKVPTEDLAKSDATHKNPQELQLRYLLKVFTESACIDWAILVSVLLGDVNLSGLSLISWIQKLQSQHLEIRSLNDCYNVSLITNIKIGISNLLKWSEDNNPNYEYVICQLMNSLMEIDIIENKSQNFDNQNKDVIQEETKQNCIIN